MRNGQWRPMFSQSHRPSPRLSSTTLLPPRTSACSGPLVALVVELSGTASACLKSFGRAHRGGSGLPYDAIVYDSGGADDYPAVLQRMHVHAPCGLHLVDAATDAAAVRKDCEPCSTGGGRADADEGRSARLAALLLRGVCGVPWLAGAAIWSVGASCAAAWRDRPRSLPGVGANAPNLRLLQSAGTVVVRLPSHGRLCRCPGHRGRLGTTRLRAGAPQAQTARHDVLLHLPSHPAPQPDKVWYTIDLVYTWLRYLTVCRATLHPNATLLLADTDQFFVASFNELQHKLEGLFRRTSVRSHAHPPTTHRRPCQCPRLLGHRRRWSSRPRYRVHQEK